LKSGASAFAKSTASDVPLHGYCSIFGELDIGPLFGWKLNSRSGFVGVDVRLELLNA
jgi:hypothetical protein